MSSVRHGRTILDPTAYSLDLTAHPRAKESLRVCFSEAPKLSGHDHLHYFL